MGFMSGPGSSARRAALITGGVILLGVGLFFVIEGPKQSRFRGMGMELILERQEAWRKELVLEGEHLNELATWEIQETLAKRSRLSEGGVKGLSRRASNAKDRLLAVEGHLISGHQELAAQLAWKLAPEMAAAERFEPETIARMWRNAGDAAWQGGRADFSPAAAYRKGILALEGKKGSGELRAWLWLDLASWHWSQATFFPEDPDSEFEAVSDAALAAEALFAARKDGNMLAEAAAARLAGNAALRRAALPVDQTREERSAKVGEAITFLTRALGVAGKSENPRLIAALNHELGIAWMLTPGEPKERAEPVAKAVTHLEAALALRPSAFKTGGVDLRELGQRLTESAETSAYLALALYQKSRLAAEAEKRGILAESVRLSDQALELSTPKERGPAWIVATAARAFAEKSWIELDADEQEDWDRHVAEMLTHVLASLNQYPIELETCPGVPSRLELVELVCDFYRQPGGPGSSTNLSGKSVEFLPDAEGALRHLFESTDSDLSPRLRRQTAGALAEVLGLKLLRSADAIQPEEREALKQERERLLQIESGDPS
jgi:hypothetical protein